MLFCFVFGSQYLLSYNSRYRVKKEVCCKAIIKLLQLKCHRIIPFGRQLVFKTFFSLFQETFIFIAVFYRVFIAVFQEVRLMKTSIE